MVMLIIFLMFKTWDGIPAMQGVSATISNASSRLFSFMIILVCLISLFSGGAMLAFGQQMEQFHTFANSFVTTLIVISTGTEDIYEDQLEIDPLLASIWHWLLVCIMYVVCLNLVLCILVDAYGESQAQRQEREAKNEHLPTLYEQTVDTLWYCGEVIRGFVVQTHHQTKKKKNRTALKNELNSRLKKQSSVMPEASALTMMLLKHQEQKARVQAQEASSRSAAGSDGPNDLEAGEETSETSSGLVETLASSVTSGDENDDLSISPGGSLDLKNMF